MMYRGQLFRFDRILFLVPQSPVTPFTINYGNLFMGTKRPVVDNAFHQCNGTTVVAGIPNSKVRRTHRVGGGGGG